jgi:hypothetical protein
MDHEYCGGISDADVVHEHEFLARYICKEYNLMAGLETFFSRYGGSDYATSEAGSEEKACESRSGVGSRRVDPIDGRRRIRSGRAGNGYADDAEHRTESCNHSRGGGNRRRQPGDVLCLRQGEHSGGSERRTASLARLRWLQRLPRLQRLQRLQRLRRWWRRRLLCLVGRLPLVLSSTTLRLR